jgi:hypothetical protein
MPFHKVCLSDPPSHTKYSMSRQVRRLYLDSTCIPVELNHVFGLYVPHWHLLSTGIDVSCACDRWRRSGLTGCFSIRCMVLIEWNWIGLGKIVYIAGGLYTYEMVKVYRVRKGESPDQSVSPSLGPSTSIGSSLFDHQVVVGIASTRGCCGFAFFKTMWYHRWV